MYPDLYRAAVFGDVGLLGQVAYDANTQIDPLLSKAPQENTALHIAARSGHVEFTRKILPLCSQLLRKRNSDDDTALHFAGRAGCLEIVQILVDFESWTEADHHVEEEGGSSCVVGLLRMQNKEGDTALHEALRSRREDMAIAMLRADPKLASLNRSNLNFYALFL